MGRQIELVKKNRRTGEVRINPPTPDSHPIAIGGQERLHPLTNFIFPETRKDLGQDAELLDFRLRQTIINMTAFNVPRAEIATLMRVSVEELEKTYGHELQTGQRQLEVNLENKVVDLALYSPDPRVAHKASMDLLRHKFGWREAAPKGGAGGGININAERVVFHLPQQVEAAEWQKQADAFRQSLVAPSDPEGVLKLGVDKLKEKD